MFLTIILIQSTLYFLDIFEGIDDSTLFLLGCRANRTCPVKYVEPAKQVPLRLDAATKLSFIQQLKTFIICL